MGVATPNFGQPNFGGSRQLSPLYRQRAEAFNESLPATVDACLKTYFKDLNGTYDPVQSMKFGTTPAPTTKPTTKPTAAPKPMDPWTPVTMADGSTKPAWMTSLVQQTGMPRTPPQGRR